MPISTLPQKSYYCHHHFTATTTATITVPSQIRTHCWFGSSANLGRSPPGAGANPSCQMLSLYIITHDDLLRLPWPQGPYRPRDLFWVLTPPGGQPEPNTGRDQWPRLHLRVRAACLHNGKGRWQSAYTDFLKKVKLTFMTSLLRQACCCQLLISLLNMLYPEKKYLRFLCWPELPKDFSVGNPTFATINRYMITWLIVIVVAHTNQCLWTSMDSPVFEVYVK